MIETWLSIAVQAAKNSGKKLFENPSDTIINSSKGRDIKLQADLDSEQIVFETLKRTNINILSEEAGFIELNTESSLCWVVDPLDGSLNYSRQIPLNCISIALWDNEEPVLGVIYDHIHNNLYTGVVGKGAYLNDKQISVSRIEEKSNSVIATGFPVYSSFDEMGLKNFIKDIQQFKKVRLFGTAAFSIAMVAKGSIEAYKEENIAFWDVAAGIALVIAAGGKVDYAFSKVSKHLMNVYATNGHLKSGS